MSEGLIPTKSHLLMRLSCCLPTSFPPTPTVLRNPKVLQAQQSVPFRQTLKYTTHSKVVQHTRRQLPFVANECLARIQITDTLSSCVKSAAFLI